MLSAMCQKSMCENAAVMRVHQRPARRWEVLTRKFPAMTCSRDSIDPGRLPGEKDQHVDGDDHRHRHGPPVHGVLALVSDHFRHCRILCSHILPSGCGHYGRADPPRWFSCRLASGPGGDMARLVVALATAVHPVRRASSGGRRSRRPTRRQAEGRLGRPRARGLFLLLRHLLGQSGRRRRGREQGGRRFDAGELVKIDKVKVKRSRVDLLTTFSEPVLVASQDGPFELYHERECKAQLIFEVPRTVIKTGNADAVLTVIDPRSPCTRPRAPP